jgi:hypothetical protein
MYLGMALFEELVAANELRLKMSLCIDVNMVFCARHAYGKSLEELILFRVQSLPLVMESILRMGFPWLVSRASRSQLVFHEVDVSSMSRPCLVHVSLDEAALSST